MYREVPHLYLEQCSKDFKDNTIREIILGLDKTVRCYETKQESLREFLKKENGE